MSDSDLLATTDLPAQPPAASTAGGTLGLGHHPGLDGVRGAALIAVLCYHGGFGWAKGGFLGVTTFFALSGFLLTTLVRREHLATGRVSMVAFWGRRARRLMPAALATLALTIGYGFWFADPTQLQTLRGDGIAALLYVANWRFIVNGTTYASLFASPSPVQQFWTLSIEEQFYAAFPLIVVGALAAGRGRWRAVAVIVTAVTAISVAWTWYLAADGARVDRIYFGTDTRLPELAVGVLLALGMHRWASDGGWTLPRPLTRAMRWAGPIALLALVWCSWGIERTDPFLERGGFVAVALLSCVLIAAAVLDGSGMARLMSVRPLVWLGAFSYAIYLLHWLVFLVLDEQRTSLEGYPLFALRMAVTLIAAWALQTRLEDPIRRRRVLTGRSALVAMAVAFGLIITGFVVVTWSPPAPAVDLTGPDQTAAPEAQSADAVRVMVVGDSTAWVLGNGMRSWADEHPDQAVVWNAARRGCGIVRGGQADRMGEVTEGVCEDWPEVWGVQLAEFDPDVVVVLAGGWDWGDRKLPEWDEWKSFGDPEFDAHLVDEFAAAGDLLSSGGADVVWLTTPCYQLEGFGQDPHHLNDDLLPQVQDRVGPAMTVFDMYPLMCPGGEFSNTIDGIDNARPDGSHLSDEAAAHVGAEVMTSLLQD